MLCLLLSLCFVDFGQSETTTFLTFSRRIETCDPEDHPLEETTTNVIWSFNSHDPITDTTILQHEQRGTKSVRFFQSENVPKLPSDAETFEIKLNKQPIKFDDLKLGLDTQYWCSAYKVTIPTKRHTIRIEPIVDNVKMVHHMIAWLCPSFNDTDLTYQGGCYNGNAPLGIQRCDQGSGQFFGGWAVGGGSLDYPLSAGYPLSGTLYLLLEIHYNNPKYLSFSDSSGFRFYHTGVLRKHDAGINLIGHYIDSMYQIPPGQEAHQTEAWCDARCLEAHLPKTGINITATFLHTHTAGRQIYLRHYRNGTELPPIVQERYYDFNYQSYKVLPQEIMVKPGDILKTECIYNTVGRVNATPMGYSTLRDEMCMAYIAYYPLIEMNFCYYMNYTAYIPSYPALSLCGSVNQSDNSLSVIQIPFVKPDLVSYVPPVCNYTPPPVNNSVFKVTNVFNKSFYQNQLALDDIGDYQMYWTVDRQNGVYHGAVEVKTEGWIGLGFSANGGMVDADVLIGWQKDGVLHFGDRRSLEQGVIPHLDQRQDFYNIGGGEITTTVTTTVPPPSSSSTSKDLVNRPTKIGVSVAGSIIGIILVFIILYFCLRRNKREQVALVEDDMIQKHTNLVEDDDVIQKDIIVDNIPTTIHTTTTTTAAVEDNSLLQKDLNTDNTPTTIHTTTTTGVEDGLIQTDTNIDDNPTTIHTVMTDQTEGDSF